MPYAQEDRLIGIDTPLGKDVLLLQGFTGHEAISRLFSFQLDLLSEKNSISFKDIIGQNVTIRVTLADGARRYFNGVVSRFAQSGSDLRFAHYQMEVVPWLWFLTRIADCRIFQNMTIPDIIKKVFSSRGFSDFKDSLTATYDQREYCAQYRESDFNFVSRLMEQYGISYFFQHDDGKHTLVLADAASAYQPCPGQSKAQYNLTHGDLHAEDVVTAWHMEQELRTGKYSLTDYNFETPSTSLLANEPTIVSVNGNSNFEIYDYPGEYLNKSQGESLTKIRMQEEEASHLVVSGSSVCRAFTSGYKFELQDHYRDDANDTYLLTEVQHVASVGASYTTGDAGTGAQYSNQLTCIPASVPFRPARVTPKPFVQGPQPALVVGKSGEEIWTDKYGRVKVQFYWDRLGKKDENSSCWIRVSHPWAGQGWGSVSIPRMGQEVIVEFLEGDPDRPIIMGRVYNAEQMPPYGLPASQVISGLKTNSTKGGGGYNEMSMDDTKGKEQITIHAQYDMGTTVEHDDTQTVHNNRTIGVDGTHTETIKKDTTITVTDGKETNTVKQEIVITSQTAHIHGMASTEIQLEVGASKLLMKSDGSIELKGVNITIDGSESVTTHGMSVTSKADVDHNTKGTIVVSEGAATNTVKGAMVMLNP
jgi:type VI secretion system secreted protein VgrG